MKDSLLGYPITVCKSLPPNTIAVLPANRPVAIFQADLDEMVERAKELWQDVIDQCAQEIIKAHPNGFTFVTMPDGIVYIADRKSSATSN
jgi:hypothetical protein